MKTILSFIIAICPLLCFCQTNSSYIIQGKANNPATVTLQYIVDGKTITNKGDVANGQINLSGTINTKLMADLIIMPGTSPAGNSGGTMATIMHLWLEPGKITINNLDSAAKGKIIFTGTQLNNETNELVQEKMALANLTNEHERDSALKAVAIRFIKAHPNSLVSLSELNITLSRGIPDLQVAEPLFSSLSNEVKNTPLGLEYQKKLEKWRKVDIGSVAPDFIQPDETGKPVKLSAYKGKYVLIDFWASWCHPCRDENPNLVKQYNLYKAANFTILSISLDERKQDWLKAINEDKLPWKQVSDLKRNNEAKVKYGVQSIPDNFLISPDGKIIGKSLRGEQLNKKLKELFTR